MGEREEIVGEGRKEKKEGRSEGTKEKAMKRDGMREGRWEETDVRKKDGQTDRQKER